MIRLGALEQAPALDCALTPAGQIQVWVRDAASQPEPDQATILACFERGNGTGLLHLGLLETSAALGPTLGYWRELARSYVAAVCAHADPGEHAELRLPEPDAEQLERLAQGAPPMRGSEHVDGALLRRLTLQLGEEIRLHSREHGAGFEGYLEALHSNLHMAGRVCLHLAENEANPERPFAFIASYARANPSSGATQSVPLSHALQEFAGQGQRARLLALLTPLQRAAQGSQLLRELVDSGDIYHPLAWSAEEAYAFLNQCAGLAQTGLVLDLPEWWDSQEASRPLVSVTLGEAEPTQLGLAALLDFDLALTLGGDTLSEEEIEELLHGEAGLFKLKGRWVQVEPEELKAALEHWRAIKRRADAGGLQLAESMRVLAGAELHGSAQVAEPTTPRWSKVNPGKWFAEQLGALRAPMIAKTIERNAGLQAELRPYQKLGVQWLWTLYGLGLGGCLADDMGLGKTIQVIALLSMLGNKRLKHDARAQHAPEGKDLLVVPASLLGNWQSELERFAPKLKPLIAHPSQLPSRQLKLLSEHDLEPYDLVVTSYGTLLRTPWMAERTWRCVVLDEAQAIKNPGTKQTRAIKRLASRWRLALTGTPVENRLADLWSIFDFLNPGLLGAAKPFAGLCRSMAAQEGDGYRPLRKLVGPYIMRRMKTDKSIISDLPDKTELTSYCLLSRAQAALYKESVGELRLALASAEGMARRGLVLSYLMRFKQICNHPAHWLKSSAFEPAESGKFQRIEELAGEIGAKQEKLLVFTQFAQLTRPLAEHLENCFGRPGLVLQGNTPIQARQERVRRFQEEEQLPFMVLSLKAGGTGLNLTAASHVIHFDRWWNPAVENQATDRAFRIGQSRNVLVHKFVCKGTIEERIDRLISGKQALSDEVLDVGAEKELTELTDDELLAMVSLDLQSAVTR